MTAGVLLIAIGALPVIALEKEKQEALPLLTPEELLGQFLFFDAKLSVPRVQSCASCHSPLFGWNGDGNPDLPVLPGASGLFGFRNAPSAAYAFGPPFEWLEDEEEYIGGVFWDGRTSLLEDQAKGPLLNHLEMNNIAKSQVVRKVCNSPYGFLFRQVYTPYACVNPEVGFEKIAVAIAEYELSWAVSPFSSKYDCWNVGKASLSSEELAGLELFEGKGKCAGCHPSLPGDHHEKALFSNFRYANLGIPLNPENPYYDLPADINPEGTAFIDYGLGAYVGDSAQYGKFKVPTLRNVAISPPYSHNGYFETLEEIVHFHNTRDVAEEDWPAPEVPDNLSTEIGNLGLTDEEEADIIAFLETLTDNYGCDF